MAHIRVQDGKDVPTVEHIELPAAGFRIPRAGRAGDEWDVPTVEHTEDHFSIFPHGSRLEEAMPTLEHVKYCFGGARPGRVTRRGTIMTDTRWDKAISNISDYLAEKENDGEGEARVLHLLYEARELLEEGKGQDARAAQDEEGSTRSTEVILQSIEDRLTKIEKQNLPQANTR
ncbi:hypothetical protein EPUS_09356 [Endocarpon pusillum Z07020]|uniref:Uncharacterized protein n=1 Tax=Endocarpon pusillum (strain Z07020 / HMAS-L-300199) TaxID=1263415 RepID=U1HRW8_ENDPU|nr:uncharacterized protein EPUS_09356 [Endocarpon pusillum Z07020]ERF71904.1 hypothetical protein EPUS_09356 [Endocarpon pusillum Z07020]